MMNRNTCLAVLACLVATGGCKVNQQASSSKDPVIATVGNTPIYSSEFKYVYDKNAVADSLPAQESLQQYLDLYVNFRLKVLDAESLGLDTLDSFNQELGGYKQQLAEPYLQDSSITTTLVKQAYDRLKEEIHASHILISLPEDADPKDTLAAYQKIADIRQRAMQGTDFTALAKENSQDPSAATNGGDLGYFTALQMVYPFEDAAYQTPAGQISQPVRTKFGYHLIKVIDRRPSQGKIKTAHIMVRTNPEAPVEDATAAKQKIDEIYTRLQKGEDWNQLTMQFSEDAGSKTKGGVLPPFTTGSMIPAFEEAAFALKNAGQYSRPVLTPYGWHIIKLVEKTGLEPFEDLETSLRQKVTRDSRSELNRTLLLKRLKTENTFVEQPKIYALAEKSATNALPAGQWTYASDNKDLQKTLFTILKQKYTLGNFFAYVQKNQQAKPNLSAPYYMKMLYTDFVNQSIMEYEKKHLEQKYPQYKYLVKEYRDGMLLFQRMEDKVWSRSLTDTTGYKNYFENNRTAYQWGNRVTATVYNAASAEVLGEVKTLLKKKSYPVKDVTFQDIYFDNGVGKLTSDHQAKLGNLAKAMAQDKNLLLEVSGYADIRENESVSAERAQAVTDYLVENGVDITRIVLKDFGRFKPVSKTDRQKNRRVAIIVTSTSKTAIEKVVNARKPLNLEITEGVFQKGDNAYVDNIDWKPGTYTLNQDGRVIYIEVAGVEQPRAKTLEEARGQVISDYQTYLEKQWIDELRKKYAVVINEKEVKKLME
jgi:peptidyl-prolyl cis-trans isomerase SurA